MLLQRDDAVFNHVHDVVLSVYLSPLSLSPLLCRRIPQL